VLTLKIESNFLGPTILVKELLTIMKKQPEGHIVSVPSDLDVFNSEDIFTYCGAKGALGKLFQGLQAGINFGLLCLKWEKS
jgi:short-subunit dehydrogenase involved in D-alanine esterification of teichoic acids